MSAGAVADLWADLIGEPAKRCPVPTPANAANSANHKDTRGATLDSGLCEALRISANPVLAATATVADSQEFAAVRDLTIWAASQQPCGFSQDSQDSQGCPQGTHCEAPAFDLSAVEWTDADIARFIDRRARLIRWGWAEPEAEKLAERLVRRDREGDDRVSCAGECTHYRPGRCGNHRSAGLNASDVGRDLAAMLQRCPGFQPRR